MPRYWLQIRKYIAETEGEGSHESVTEDVNKQEEDNDDGVEHEEEEEKSIKRRSNKKKSVLTSLSLWIVVSIIHLPSHHLSTIPCLWVDNAF